MDFLYQAGPLVGFILNLVLAFFVLRQNPHRRLNQVFFLYLISMALWAFAIFGMRYSPTLKQALPWEKAFFGIIPLVSVSFLHFVNILIGNKKLTWQIPVAYGSALIAIAIAPTGLFVKDMRLMWYGYGFVPGPLILPFMIIFYGFVVLALVRLLRAYGKLDSKTERRRYAFVAAGVIVSLLGLLIDALAARGIHIYPMGIFSNIIFSGLSAYAILRYRLLDIAVIIRKTTAYILVSAFGIGVYMGLLTLGYVFLSGAWNLPLWINVLVLLVFAVGLQPILRWTQSKVDKVFYRGRYDYLNALERLAEENRSITDLEFIGNSLVDTISRAMQCSRVSVFLPDPDAKYFEPIPKLEGEKHALLRLSRESALVWWLSNSQDVLNSEDIEILPQLRALSAKERQMLNDLDARVFIPLLTRDGLRGILILGQKLSEQEYSSEEIRLLRLVASQLATIVDNARLYDLQTRRYREQAILARLSMTISAELDFSKVCGSLIKEIQNIWSAEYAAIILVDEQKDPINTLEFSTLARVPPDMAQKIFKAENLSQIDGARYKPEIGLETDSELKSILDLAGLNSILYLPMYSKDNILGYFILCSYQFDAYNEDFIRLLDHIAVQMAIAYEKSHLYESERKARLELEKQDKERTEFINSLIHEIKTPITAMMASSDLLSEELSTTPGILGELAGNLDTSINNLNRRVSELTDFAKLQTTEIKVHLQPVDINLLAQRADAMVSNLLQTKNQMLNCELTASPHEVQADPDRIIQILLNLLTNASKYSKPYTNIHLKTYNLDNYLVTEVQDSGTPIVTSDKEELFRPYNLARKKESGGLGLGLFICKRLVELHGGKIWLETYDTGNRFKFSLPKIGYAEVN